MNRTTAAALVAIVAAAEFLIVALVLPGQRWQAMETLLATGFALVAWGITIALLLHQVSGDAGAASIWTRWPALVVGFLWGLLSALPIAFAMELTTKWILGLHAFAGLACLGVWLTFRTAGAHMDGVEGEIAGTDDAHADLQRAVSRVRLQIGRSGLAPETSQQARTLLDRALTVPRSALRGALAEDLVFQILQVGVVAAEGTESLAAALQTLEDTLAVLKTRQTRI